MKDVFSGSSNANPGNLRIDQSQIRSNVDRSQTDRTIGFIVSDRLQIRDAIECATQTNTRETFTGSINGESLDQLYETKSIDTKRGLITQYELDEH